MFADLQTSNEEVARFENTSELSFLGRPERVKVIKEQLGFYPQSNDETSRIVALLGRETRDYPALSYLGEIYSHQLKAKADAPKALRSMVRNFEDYAGNAVNETHYMKSFLDQLVMLEPNNRTGFLTLFPVVDWRYDNTQIATFSAMSRYLETSHFAENETDDRLGKRELIDFTEGEAREARILENLGGLRVSNLEKLAKAIQASQENRFSFWVAELEASKKHFFARDAATTALNELMAI